MGVMTKVEGSPDRDVAIPGMAYFAGTGPAGKTCGHCAYKAYFHPRRRGRQPGCAKFYELTGKNGPAIDAHNRACKYFQPDKRDK